MNRRQSEERRQSVRADAQDREVDSLAWDVFGCFINIRADPGEMNSSAPLTDHRTPKDRAPTWAVASDIIAVSTTARDGGYVIGGILGVILIVVLITWLLRGGGYLGGF